MTSSTSNNKGPSGSAYGADYYASGCGRPYQRDEVWLGFFDRIADRIISDIQPATVLDAGCAMGFLVEALRNRGVQAWGIDISEYAISQVHESVRAFCSVGSITQSFPRRYDLIVCIEVLEHLPKSESELAAANFCQHTDDVLFSSTPFDYKEATHFNVQPPEYWAEQFARHGFYRDVDFDVSIINAWATRFRKSNEPVHRIVRDYERRLWQLQQENHDLRQLIGDYHENAVRYDRMIKENESLHLSAQYWQDLATRYANGRLMRLLRWLKQGGQ